MRRRERLAVVGAERVGPYTLVRVRRGSLEPGAPGQFFMLEAPGRVLPRPFSLCLAPKGELAFLVEPVGPYTLLHLERGGLEPGLPGQFFMLEAPGRVLPRPMSLCLVPPGELAFLIDPIGPGTTALCAVEPGEGPRDRHHRDLVGVADAQERAAA